MTADPRTFSSRAISFSMVCLVVRLCDSKPLSSLPRVATRTTAATLSTALSPADVAFNAAATFSAKVSSAKSALMPRLKGGRLSALSSGRCCETKERPGTLSFSRCALGQIDLRLKCKVGNDTPNLAFKGFHGHSGPF